MSGKKSVIETGVDKLVRLISDRKKISIKEAAKELGVSVSSIEEWADFLEDEGIINIKSQFATVYLLERNIGKKELAEKVKAVRDEKEDFVRRVESSVNAVERDHEELKLIDSEFRKMRSMLEERFSHLGGKLDKLEDFRRSHHQMAVQCRALEEDHEEKLKKLEKKLKTDESEYKQVMSMVESELEKLQKEEDHVASMKSAEKELQSKVNEVNTLLSKVQKEIDLGNRQLSIEEERLAKSESSAKKIKDDIAETANQLEDMTKQFADSKKELQEMEKSFLKDVKSLSTGQLEKIGSYKESKDMIVKFKKFFDQTKEVESLIHKAEKEEEALHEEFEKLGKKVQAFSVVTSIPEIKKEMAGMQTELVAIEQNKKLLAGQLRKLRSVIRSVIK